MRPALGGALLSLAAFSSVTGQPALAPMLDALQLAGYPPGTQAPELSSRTVRGRSISAAGLRGKVVVVNFWATWCAACRDELPALERLHRTLGPDGLVVLGINVREQPAVIERYSGELGLSFPLVVDPGGELQRSYGAIGLPTTFLIARDGRAVARAIGPRDWSGDEARALIRALLAEPIR